VTMSTLDHSATDEAAGADRAGALAGITANHWIAVLGIGSVLYLWWVRRGSLRSLLD